MVKKNPPRMYPNPQTITVTIASLKREILTTTTAAKKMESGHSQYFINGQSSNRHNFKGYHSLSLKFNILACFISVVTTTRSKAKIISYLYKATASHSTMKWSSC